MKDYTRLQRRMKTAARLLYTLSFFMHNESEFLKCEKLYKQQLKYIRKSSEAGILTHFLKKIL